MTDDRTMRGNGLQTKALAGEVSPAHSVRRKSDLVSHNDYTTINRTGPERSPLTPPRPNRNSSSK